MSPLRARTNFREAKNIAAVPREYKFQDASPYPVDNKEDFEWWLSKNLFDTDIPESLTYLPVTWTAYYKRCNYASDKARMQRLQNFLDALPRDKRYFTICQWDDGILHDFPVYKFNMGCVGDYQLPLICQPHQWAFPGIKKDIPVSFIGRVTHPIRQAIVDKYSEVPGWYVSTKPHSLPEYCKILARSKYVLCPRGYGATSFRIAEALQYGCEPVYISDVHLKPHGENLSIHASPQDDLSGIENLYSDPIWKAYDPFVNTNLYRRYFTYEANKQLIIEQLKRMV